MNRFSPQTDEHTVVAFLTGIGQQRDEAALHLTANPMARELLCMAQEALEALGLPSALHPPTPENCRAEA